MPRPSSSLSVAQLNERNVVTGGEGCFVAITVQLRSGKDEETLVKEIGLNTAKPFPSFLFWNSC